MRAPRRLRRGRVRSVSSAQLRELVDVERESLASHRDDEAEPDAYLGCGDGHDRDREHLAVAVAPVAREADEGEIAAVEHDLEREKDDQRAASEHHADSADP